LVREFVPEQNQNMSKEIRDFDSAERWERERDYRDSELEREVSERF
jgi:hypothetical protein